MLRNRWLVWLKWVLVLAGITLLCKTLISGQKARFHRSGSTPTSAAVTTLPLQNWNFETGPENTLGIVTNWDVYGNVGAVNFEGATSGTHSAALSAGGDSAGNKLSQTFSTTAGKMYVVDFDSAVYGHTDSTLQLKVRVFGNHDVYNQILIPPYYDTSNASLIRFHHYHFSFMADSSTTTIEFSDLLLGNQNADIAVDSVSVAPVPPSFSDWQTAHFTPAELGNPQVCGWNADPDGDGTSNGLEYYSGCDPRAGIPISDASLQPLVTIETIGPQRYLTFKFRRLLGWSGNAAVVGVSDDLINWDYSGNQIEEAANPLPSGDGMTEIVQVHLKNPINQFPIAKKFFRLQLTQ